MRSYLPFGIITVLSLVTGYGLGVRRRLLLQNLITYEAHNKATMVNDEDVLRLVNCYYDRRRDVWIPFELTEV